MSDATNINPDMHAALCILGFTTQAATAVMGDQGIDSLEELRVLDESLCKVIRKPGCPINTVGATISLQAEKMTVFYCNYLEQTSRQVGADSITLSNIRS